MPCRIRFQGRTGPRGGGSPRAAATVAVAVLALTTVSACSEEAAGRPGPARPTPSAASSPAATQTSPTASPTRTGPVSRAEELRVKGNRIVTADGKPYRLLGTNKAGSEYACIQGNGVWADSNDDDDLGFMQQWRIRAVRIPLNEQCWIGGFDDIAPAGSGQAYRDEIVRWVDLILARGMTPIVELHWSWGAYTGPEATCEIELAACQKPMPNRKYSVRFWTEVAQTFGDRPAVVFDLFNEPWPETAMGLLDTSRRDRAWRCWRDGGKACGKAFRYEVAGMQDLLDAVRSTGAKNVVLAGGLEWANDLRGWLRYKPKDPTGNLAAAFHTYSWNRCNTVTCFKREYEPVAKRVPLVAGEMGSNDCEPGYITRVMNWADRVGAGYLGWTWNSSFSCVNGPSIIKDVFGTPTDLGQALRDRLTTLPELDAYGEEFGIPTPTATS